MSAKVTQEEFIAKAGLLTNPMYTFENAIYVTSKTKVEVTCAKHGPFYISPNNLYKGKGCRKCMGDRISKRLLSTTDEFVEKAKKVHGDKYGYFTSNYVTAKTNVEILCNTCGHVFSQTPDNHLHGKGCPACKRVAIGLAKALPEEEFLRRLKEVHGDLYDHSQVKYTGSDNKILIVCKKHGGFYQKASNHLRGDGCTKCFNERASILYSLGLEEFLLRAEGVHGGRYDYSKVKYVNGRKNVIIGCSEHEDFHQTPESHLRGSGCPACGITGFATNKPGKLYLLQSDDWIKVGITNKEVADRLLQVNRASPQKFKAVTEYNLGGQECSDIETRILRILRTIAKPVIQKFHGSSECFYGISAIEVIKLMEEATNG